MRRRPTSRRIVALGSLVALVVVALGAGAGQSALGGAASRAFWSAARLTRSRTSTRRVTTTSGPSPSASTSSSTSTSQATGRRSCPRSRRAAALAGDESTGGATSAEASRSTTAPRFDSADVEVLVRSCAQRADRETGRSQQPVVAALQPQERDDERQVRGDVQPQGAAVDLAVHPRDGRRRHRSQRLVPGQPVCRGTRSRRSGPGRIELTGTRRAAGRVRAVRRLLGPAGEERRI